MTGHKTNLNRFKKIEIISIMCSDHNGLKLETNLKEKTQKHSIIWRLNNMLLSNEQVNNAIKEEVQKCLETNESDPKPMGHREGSPEREVHSDTGLPKKDRKISNKQPNSIPKRTRGTTTNKAQSKQKEGNNQDQGRIKWHRDQKNNSKDQ